MNEPVRLFDEDGTDEERRLIGVARAEEPPPGAAARLLATLGVAGAVSLAPGAAHATGEVAAGSLAAGTASGSVTLLSFTKWLGVGFLGGALTVAAATAVTHVAPSRAPFERPAAPASTGVPSAVETRIERATAPTPAELPVAASAALPRTEAPDAGGSLLEELVLLEQARRALASGRPSEARQALARHRERFGSGALTEEAAVLRVELSFAGGEHELGTQAAEDFLAAHPASPHAARIRSLLSRAGRDPNRSTRPSSP